MSKRLVTLFSAPVVYLSQPALQNSDGKILNGDVKHKGRKNRKMRL